MSKKKKNYLDFVPGKSEKNTWDIKDNIVVINMTHKGIYNRIAQKLFNTPKVSHVSLDEYGSFVWQHIDGVNSVGDIALQLKEHFGDDIEPLYNRLVKYMQILYNNKFIVYLKK